MSKKNDPVEQELEEKRATLLRQIELGRDGDQETLEHLKTTYNEIVEKQLNMQRGIRWDPLEVLPSEMWIQIFLEYRDDVVDPINAMLGLTLVCDRWLRAITKAPILWSKVIVGAAHTEPDKLLVLKAALHLSQEVPLTLFIEHPTREWDQVLLPLLLPHTGRVARISLRPSSLKSSKPMLSENPSVFSILESLGSMHILNKLSFHSGQSLGTAKFAVFPALPSSIKSIGGTYVPVSLLARNNLQNLRSIAIEDSLDSLVPYLVHMKALSRLHVNCRSFKKAKPFQTRRVLPSNLPLDRLEAFTFNQPYHDLLFPILRQMRNIRELEITTMWAQFSELLSTLPSFPSLRELKICIRCGSSTAVPPPSFEIGIEGPLPSLAELTLNFHRDYRQASLPESELRYICEAFQALQKCAPYIQKLAISNLGHTNLAIGYISSLKDHLQALRLHIQNPKFNVSIPRIEGDSLISINLALKCASMSSLLAELYAPKLHTVTLHCSGEIPFESQPAVALDSETYRRVRWLKWGPDALTWNISSLNSLRRIYFKETARTTSTDLCVFLIYRPTELPALERLYFERVPEWDCLIMMLERRHFLPDSSTQPIKLLSFPTEIPYTLLRPLVDLLRRRFTHLPSYHELSLSSIKDTYFGSKRCANLQSQRAYG